MQYSLPPGPLLSDTVGAQNCKYLEGKTIIGFTSFGMSTDACKQIRSKGNYEYKA
jgi:hypothetical protein